MEHWKEAVRRARVALRDRWRVELLTLEVSFGIACYIRANPLNNYLPVDRDIPAFYMGYALALNYDIPDLGWQMIFRGNGPSAQVAHYWQDEPGSAGRLTVVGLPVDVVHPVPVPVVTVEPADRARRRRARGAI